MKLIYAGLLVGAATVLPQIYAGCEDDADGDGYTESEGDCDDTDATVYEGAPELCDSKDNDCDSSVDEDPVDVATYYLDSDADGYGSGTPGTGCEVPDGYTVMDGDCDDTDSSVNPGADEAVGDAVDSNCNGHMDYVTTYAGTGVPGYSGDGGAATAAQLYNPFTVVEDSSGNLYIADSANHRVRKVDTSGTISTYAGTGASGSSGDNGPATSAQLNYPRGLALDGSGNLYISDSSNHKVRKVDSVSHKITTFAGSGVPGYGGDGGAATSASLAYPYGIAMDSAGTLYIADSNNHRIRMVSGGNIYTVAGTGVAGYGGDGASASEAMLNYPRGVAVDDSGDFFIADTSNYRVRMVDGSGTIMTVAGNGSDGYSGDGGAATSAKLNDPYGVTVDGFGNLFVADTDNSRIRKVAGGVIATVMGTGAVGYSGDGVEGGSTKAQVNLPYSVSAGEGGDLWVADSKNGVIRLAEW